MGTAPGPSRKMETSMAGALNRAHASSSGSATGGQAQRANSSPRHIPTTQSPHSLHSRSAGRVAIGVDGDWRTKGGMDSFHGPDWAMPSSTKQAQVSPSALHDTPTHKSCPSWDDGWPLIPPPNLLTTNTGSGRARPPCAPPHNHGLDGPAAPGRRRDPAQRRIHGVWSPGHVLEAGRRR